MDCEDYKAKYADSIGLLEETRVLLLQHKSVLSDNELYFLSRVQEAIDYSWAEA